MNPDRYDEGWRDAIRFAAKMLLHRDDDWAMWNTEALAECIRYVATMEGLSAHGKDEL